MQVKIITNCGNKAKVVNALTGEELKDVSVVSWGPGVQDGDGQFVTATITLHNIPVEQKHDA